MKENEPKPTKLILVRRFVRMYDFRYYVVDRTGKIHKFTASNMKSGFLS